MSRSYRKNPILKDGGKSSKKSKRKANQLVRRKYQNIDFPRKGNFYRRFYEQYDINDYVYYWSKEDAIRFYEKESKNGYYHRRFKTLKDFLAYWYKLMVRK